VAVKDIQDVEHPIEVTAETLYEAIATALAALQKDNWVGEISQGFTTVHKSANFIQQTSDRRSRH
jgi:hypothetical protein